MTTPPQLPELPSITTDDLLKMIGDRDVTIARQATLISQQAARLSALDPGNGQAFDTGHDATVGSIAAGLSDGRIAE